MDAPLRVVGILLCAGSAQRMGFDKLLTPLCGRTAIERSMDALLAGGVTELVFAVSERTRGFVEALECPVPRRIVQGGETRQDSVCNALTSGTGDIAVIHDAARCLVPPATVRASIESAVAFGSGVAAVPVADTVLRQAGGKTLPVPRDGLYRMQTPQTFRYVEILRSYAAAEPGATDDCTLYAAAGFAPRFIACTEDNFKLTTPADFARAQRLLTRYGTGFDTHRLVPDRKLVLGGVDIAFEKGLLGHSDADVLTHAIMDALLGAAGLPDIGQQFPDTDPAYAGADSLALLAEVVRKLAALGLTPMHISATVIAQRPKLAPHLPAMRDKLAAALGLDAANVALAATTTEGMNDEGRGLCISAQAVAALC